MKDYNFYVYILTNLNKTVLYTGITNDLERRLFEHKNGSSEFTTKYNCYYLIYWEHHKYVLNAIDREKQIKSCT